MNAIQQNSRNQRADVICPHLGLLDDPATSLGFPSVWNYCHRPRPIEAANLEHQNAFCLTANHKQCPVFTREGDFSMPPEMRVRGAEVRNGRRTVPRIALGLFIALMVVLIGRQIIVQVFHDTSPIVAPINDARAPDSTILATSSNANPLSMSVMETTSTTIPPQTLTPSLIPSPTSTPRRPLLVDVPLGLRNQFLIHKVFEGESLELLANKHHTTVEAIRAVNYYLPSPVWVDFVVVIPLKPDDIQNMPPFEPYMVVGENITIHDLAQKLAVDVSALAYYNALDEGYVLVPGDWLLIPRTRPTP